MSRETGRLTVLHVSDVHGTRDGRLYGHVDGVARLRDVGDYVRRTGITPEAIVVTGDLVERGHGDAYHLVREAFDELERTAAAPVLSVLGNHDDPARAHALRGHERAHHRVVRIDELRFVLLDSSSGALGEAQLDWLRVQLREPHGIGTIVALHHPPIGSPMPVLAQAGLRDAEAFLEAIEDSDVRAVLAGHFHHPLSASLRGVPVWVGPSLAYHQVMDAGPDRVSGHDRPMFSLIHLTPTAVTATGIGLESPAPLFTSSLTR